MKEQTQPQAAAGTGVHEEPTAYPVRCPGLTTCERGESQEQGGSLHARDEEAETTSSS